MCCDCRFATLGELVPPYFALPPKRRLLPTGLQRVQSLHHVERRQLAQQSRDLVMRRVIQRRLDIFHQRHEPLLLLAQLGIVDVPIGNRRHKRAELLRVFVDERRLSFVIEPALSNCGITDLKCDEIMYK